VNGLGKAVAIVPVRVSSQRLPGKALLASSGKPLFVHTCEQAMQAACFDAVYVATDSDDVAKAAGDHNIPIVLTTEHPRTGSERCAEALAKVDAEFIVDVQGDWPEIDPHDLEQLVEALAKEPTICATLAAPLADDQKAKDPNVVKVVRSIDGDALYFSRAAIPHSKEHGAERLRHIGVYGFNRQTLLRIPGLPSSGLAETEGLEQLKFLENGIPIRVLIAQSDPWGIETRADYDALLERLSQRAPPRS